MKRYFFLHWNQKKFRQHSYIDTLKRPSGYCTQVFKYGMCGCHGNQFIELGRANMAIFVF